MTTTKGSKAPRYLTMPSTPVKQAMARITSKMPC